MHYGTYSFTLSCLFAWAVSASPAAAQCERECLGCESRQPCLKFLDDLWCWGCPPEEENPFEERIETDRHDFTQSAKTVGRGVLQIESGYTFFYKQQDGEKETSHAAPELLARIGLSEDIEFRVQWNYIWRYIEEKDDEDGATDMIWAFKLGMTELCGCVPESALEIRFTAPTGGNAWNTGRVDWGLDYIYDWRISERATLYGSTGYSADALGDFSLLPEEQASDHFGVWSQSAALGLEMTESMTLYLEWYGLYTHGLEDNISASFFNGGVDYYVTNDFVLDLRVGTGLTADADDLFVGVGGGIRF